MEITKNTDVHTAIQVGGKNCQTKDVMNIKKILEIERSDKLIRYQSLLELNQRMKRRKFIKRYNKLIEKIKKEINDKSNG